MQTNNISFCALPINKTNIQKFDKISKRYIDYPVNFVKLESNNKNDMEVINECAKKWKDATYIKKIATAAHWIGNRHGLLIDVYALTSQKDSFENLNYDNILGYAEMRQEVKKPKNTLLYYLQVKPSAINIGEENNTTYKKVGTSVVKSLQKIYKYISLFAVNSPIVEAFYKKLGFIEDYYGERHYSWSSNIFRMMQIHIDRFRLKYRC